MVKPYRVANLAQAKDMRHEMTKEEWILWSRYLRNYKPKFYRQRRISKFIVDFYCAKAKLVIELDGSQHYLVEGKASDDKRTEALQTYGLSVVRIPNNQVRFNLDGVCTYIDQLVTKRITG